MMRKRSGALHSDSEEGYIELANLAEEHSALFYDQKKPFKDQRKRKYAMSLAMKKQQHFGSEDQPQSQDWQNSPFDFFDFDQQTDNFQRDCKEQDEKQMHRCLMTQKSRIVIICFEETWVVSQFLRYKFGIACDEQDCHASKVIDLCVHQGQVDSPSRYFTDCFWIINKTHQSFSHNLVSVYVRTCTHLWDLTQSQNPDPNQPVEVPKPDFRCRLLEQLRILENSRGQA